MADEQASEEASTSSTQPVTMQRIADELSTVYDLARLGLQQTEDATASAQNASFHQVERRIWDALIIARHHAAAQAAEVEAAKQ